MTLADYTTFASVPKAPSVVTFGAFDGVHRGHQHLLAELRRSADDRNARVVVVTFDPLPAEVFNPQGFAGRVVSTERRRELLGRFGADVVIDLAFSRAFAQQSAEAFMDDVRLLGPILAIHVGDDFALGNNREGTPARLAEIMAPDGTEVSIVDRVQTDGVTIGSRVIRQLIQAGEPERANAMLGHRFLIEGEVVKGAQVGRTIGFPTANVAPPVGRVPLRDGIYASFAGKAGEPRIPAMTYVGTRPAVNTGDRFIETHLLDFDGDLYGETLVTEIVSHLRPDADFPSVEALVAQLAKDEVGARACLAETRTIP